MSKSNSERKKLIEEIKNLRKLKKIEELEEEKVQEEFDNPLTAGALGTLRGATLGLSDKAAVELGLIDPQELKDYQTANPISSTIGEVVGTTGTLIGTGGTGAALKLGGKAATKFASKPLAKKIIQQGVAGSLEGGAVGVQETISQSAQDKTDITVESLLANTGSSAVLGGLAGGVFSAAGGAAKKATQKAGPLAGKAKQKARDSLFNPEDTALDLVGVSAAGRTKLAEKNITGGDVLDLITKKTDDGTPLMGKWIDSSETMHANFIKRRSQIGQEIGDAYKKASGNFKNIIQTIRGGQGQDFIMTPNTEEGRQAAKLFSQSVDLDELASAFERKYADILEETFDFTGRTKKIGKFADEIRKKGQTLRSSGKILDPQELHKLRISIDDNIKWSKKPGQFTDKEEALRDLRTMLNDRIFKYLDSAEQIVGPIDEGSSGLVNSLKSLNREYQVLSEIIPHAERKVNRDAAKSLFGLTDYLAAGGLAPFGGGPAVFGLGLKKALQSDARRRLQISRGLIESQENVVRRINSAVGKFADFAKKPKAAVAPAVKVGAIKNFNAALGADTSDDDSVDKQLEAAMAKLQELGSDPVKLQETVVQRTSELSQMNDTLASRINQKSIELLNFLNQKLPPKPVNVFKKDPIRFSEEDKVQFSDYLDAAENPLRMLDELNENRLNPRTVETVQTLYPELFKAVEAQIVGRLMEKDETVPYDKRMKLSLLFGKDFEDSLRPQTMSMLQKNYQQPEREIPGSSANLQIPQEPTTTQRLTNK